MKYPKGKTANRSGNRMRVSGTIVISFSFVLLMLNYLLAERWIGLSRLSFGKRYMYYRSLAMRLAALPPDQVLEELEKNDPFGVRRFERRLLYTESSQGSFLRDIRSLFPCPVDRITLPDRRNKKRNFRNGKVFLFFQHLRKAGGTNFCTLAQRNLPKSQVPSYYCMPDYDWKDKKCAGCFSRWTNEEIVENMKAKNHRILGNEWDPFEPERFFDLPAVFATSFRKPLHRALSQFRFECIESRVRRYMHDPNREGAKERKQNLRPCLVLRDLSSIR